MDTGGELVVFCRWALWRALLVSASLTGRTRGSASPVDGEKNSSVFINVVVQSAPASRHLECGVETSFKSVKGALVQITGRGHVSAQLADLQEKEDAQMRLLSRRDSSHKTFLPTIHDVRLHFTSLSCSNESMW